ncbi:MAG: DUF4352 domain-containing protein [Bryobacteraceae bacterium]
MRLHSWLFLLVGLCALCLTSCAEHAWEVRTYSMGQKVTLGGLTYLGIDTQWFPSFGEGPGSRAAQNQFLLVRLSITNGGHADAALPSLSIEDTAGRRFPEQSDGEGVEEWIGMLRTLAPADTIAGNVLFDVPTGHYTLHIFDEDGQREARIDLPLNFQNGSTEGPAPDLRNAPPPARKK